jgi:hypothetical protein
MVAKQPEPRAETVCPPSSCLATPGTVAIDGWPTSRPSLAYQWVLDVSAVKVHRLGAPPLLIASHTRLGAEAARRLGVAWSGPSADSRSSRAPVVSVHQSNGTDAWTAGPDSQVPTVVWVEPTRHDWLDTVGRLERLLHGSGRLLVLTSSPWLARGLPEWPAQDAPARETLLGSWNLANRLRARQWRVEEVIGFRGVRSLGLGVLARLAIVMRRDGLADRLAVRMRASHVERGLLAHLGTVALVTAQPPVGRSARDEVGTS